MRARFFLLFGLLCITSLGATLKQRQEDLKTQYGDNSDISEMSAD